MVIPSIYAALIRNVVIDSFFVVLNEQKINYQLELKKNTKTSFFIINKNMSAPTTPTSKKLILKESSRKKGPGSIGSQSSSEGKSNKAPVPKMIDTSSSSITSSVVETTYDDDDIATVVGQEGNCIHPECREPRTLNFKKTHYIRHCALHAEIHRQRCRKSYSRRVARNTSVSQTQSTVSELNSLLTEERLTSRKLRKRLETIQQDHDAFVSKLTDQSVVVGTDAGNITIVGIIQQLNNSISQLVLRTENEDSFKHRLRELEAKYDILLEEKAAIKEKVTHLKGQMLSHKQIMEMLNKS
jgi:hypothetical protein